MRPGQSFENADVARNYTCRPEYPAEVYKKLVALSPSNTNALDLGCGTGKIARGLCQSFESITAVDASASMLQVAKELQGEGVSNINWVHGLAESVDIGVGPYDLIVAAASIHWMDHTILFPRLLDGVRHEHVFAIVDGDGAHEPPWQQQWDDFLATWILKLKGEIYEPDREESEFEQYMTRYRDWIDVKGEVIYEREVSQSIDQFIRCQHSRDTFAPSKLGSQIGLFDAETRSILEPHAEDELLTYTLQTRVEWGVIKSSQ